MLNPIHAAIQSLASHHEKLNETVKTKKKCLLKRKINNKSSESPESSSLLQNYYLYHVLYFNFETIKESAKDDCIFPQEIFKFNFVTKVFKNNDRITLDLKLTHKLAKSTIHPIPIQQLALENKHDWNNLFHLCDQNLDFTQIFQQLNQISQKLKVNKQNEKEYEINRSLFLSEDEVSRRTQNILQNKKSSNYLIFEHLFGTNVKKIKNIHISNQMLKMIGYENETLVFQILEKRALPFEQKIHKFRIFKSLDYKKFVSNVFQHFTKVLKNHLREDGGKSSIEEAFQMEAKISTSENTEKPVKVRWTCSHPSLIVIEVAQVFEEIQKSNEVSTEVIDQTQIKDFIEKIELGKE